MKRIVFGFALAMLLAAPPAALAGGRIVVNNDEWTLGGQAFSVSDTTTFVHNVAGWFTGGGAGNFLAWSTNFGLTSPQLAQAMQAAGHTWTVSTAVPQTLAALQQYDGVYLMGNVFNNQVLIDYVMGGGNVYLGGGTGGGGAVAEAASWNTFLAAFGLSFAPYYNNSKGVPCAWLAASSGHPVLAGVSQLYYCNGNSVSQLDAGDPATAILASFNGEGLIAVYDGACADADGDGLCDADDACPLDAGNDADGDGVCGDIDMCPGTAASDTAAGVPSMALGVNRWADTDGDGVFDTTLPPKGKGPDKSFTLAQTGGCSCAQIIVALGLGEGHVKYGCSSGAVEDWIAQLP